jgi:hypothetical protein
MIAAMLRPAKGARSVDRDLSDPTNLPNNPIRLDALVKHAGIKSGRLSLFFRNRLRTYYSFVSHGKRILPSHP